jgi:N-acetyltransferase
VKLAPVVLEGRHTRLEPLADVHLAPLAAAARPELFRHMPFTLATPAGLEAFVRITNKLAAEGSALYFAAFDRAAGALVGGTGYWNYDRAHRRLEIGATWLAPRAQRTGLNTENKLLLLQHAFETLGCQRVEFKTDSLNLQSRTALARIGAIEEGTLRNHMLMPDGRKRHSVVFAVIDDDWPVVKARLEALIARAPPGNFT